MTDLSTDITDRPADASTGALLIRFVDQLTGLLKAEIALAKQEMANKGKRLGVGIGMFGAAAFLGIYALAALITAGGLALALVFDGWLAALIVAGGLIFLAALLIFAGVKSVKRGTPPVPTAAIDGTKKDLATAKGRRG